MADPTVNLRQQLADHEAVKDKREAICLSKLSDCSGLHKEETSVGTKAVVS